MFLRKRLVIVMAAFLVPALLLGAFMFSHLRAKEREHLCQLRMKQMGLGIQWFSKENDEYYPQLSSDPGHLALLLQDS